MFEDIEGSVDIQFLGENKMSFLEVELDSSGWVTFVCQIGRHESGFATGETVATNSNELICGAVTELTHHAIRAVSHNKIDENRILRFIGDYFTCTNRNEIGILGQLDMNRLRDFGNLEHILIN